MSRQLVLALNTEMAEKYYFIEHTEDYSNVFVWVAPGSHTLTKLYISLYFYAPLFTEFELQKVFEKFNGNRASNNENINKVHDLPGHPSYLNIIVKHIYCYISQILGERLHDH